MDRSRPFKKLTTEDLSGARPVASDFECGEGCEPHGSGSFWGDGTQFIPDPTDGDQWPKGICELISTENEILFCWPVKHDPLPPEPVPLPNCGTPIRPIKMISVAMIGDTRQSRCFIGEFRPFHRLGTSSEARCESGKVFEKAAPGGGSPTWPIYKDFIQNFDRRDMWITGPAWLSITHGCLIGEAPEVTSETIFEFVVTARNSKGSESVNLKIIVEPIGPAQRD